MDGTVPKILYNFYLNFMNFLIFLKFQGAGLKNFKFPQGGQTFGQGGAGPLPPPPPPPAATPLGCTCATFKFAIFELAYNTLLAYCKYN